MASLSNLVATGAPRKVGAVWVVTVAYRDGAPTGAGTCVTFRTKREAVEFAGGAS